MTRLVEKAVLIIGISRGYKKIAYAVPNPKYESFCSSADTKLTQEKRLIFTATGNSLSLLKRYSASRYRTIYFS